MRDGKSVLLVEDDIVDHMLVKRVFGELHIENPLQIQSDGEAALIWLRQHVADRPCLIILDLNMPRLGGIEMLRVLKQDDELRMIPVVVLTTSREEYEKMESFRLGVAGYMIKPVEYVQFVEMLRAITAYWKLCEQPT